MASILFIGEVYLKNNTNLSNNVSIDLILPNIQFSQDSEVQEVLGTNFYNALQASYSAQTLTAAETTLMGYIKPWLAELSAANSVPFLAIQLRAKGANKLSSEWAQPAETIDVKFITQLLRDRAEYYKKIVLNYLCQNSALFPLYIDSSTQLINPEHQSPYECDFYLGDTCSHCGGYGCGCFRWH